MRETSAPFMAVKESQLQLSYTYFHFCHNCLCWTQTYQDKKKKKNQLEDRTLLLTNICIPVIFNNFSQLKMARHNGHLIKKKNHKMVVNGSGQGLSTHALHSHLKRRLSAVVFGLFFCSPVEQNSCTAFLQQTGLKSSTVQSNLSRRIWNLDGKLLH